MLRPEQRRCFSVTHARWRFFRVNAVGMVVALIGLPCSAGAHTGRAPEPHDLWTLWTAAPLVVLFVLMSAVLYVVGMRRVWERAGIGHGVARWRATSFAVGLGVVSLALLSPIDAVGAALFSIHMVQHVLLIGIAVPLIVLGKPWYVTLWVLTPRTRRTLTSALQASQIISGTWRSLRTPVVAWLLHTGALWLWHVPRFYDAALRNAVVHDIEHLSFVATALLFWWLVLDGDHLPVGAATFYLFSAALQSTLLGALLALARHPWYVSHYGTTQPWGLTPLEDQQIAGLIMWIPAGVVYLAAMLPRLWSVLRRNGNRLRLSHESL